MIEYDDYRALIRQLDDLVSSFELDPDFTTRQRAVALLTGLDTLHREALSRLVAALRQTGAGPALDAACAADPIVRTLLSLYEL